MDQTIAGIPGLAGYVAAQDQAQQRGAQQLQQMAQVQTLQDHFQQQAELSKARQILQSEKDPEKVIPALVQIGPTGAAMAHQYATALKSAADIAATKALPGALRAINEQSNPAPVPQTRQIAPDIQTADPADAAFSVQQPAGVPAGFSAQQRITNLQRLSEAYAAHPAVVQRINGEIDRLQKTADQAPQTRSRISGETSIQEEYRNGQWTEIGRGPRFSRSVVNVNAPSQEPLTKESVRDLAIQSMYDPNATAGYRRDTTAMSRIANERQNIMREAKITSEDVVSGRAGFKADTLSLNKLTPQYDAITAFEKTAIRNGNVLKELADKVDTTGTPVIERWIRAGRKSVAGDEDIAKFDAQMNLYRAEAARILTQPNLSGVLTDTARREMEHVIGGDASAKQIKGVVDLLERDFGNRKATLEEQIGSIRARMRGRVAPGGETPPPAQPTPQPQADARTVPLPDGRIKTFPTPAAAAAFRKAAGL
jgi:hypothetical protein